MKPSETNSYVRFHRATSGLQAGDLCVLDITLAAAQGIRQPRRTDLDMDHPVSVAESTETSEIASIDGLASVSPGKEVTLYPEVSVIAPPRVDRPVFKVHHRDTRPTLGTAIVDDFQVRQAVFDFVVAASKQTEDKQGMSEKSTDQRTTEFTWGHRTGCEQQRKRKRTSWIRRKVQCASSYTDVKHC